MERCGFCILFALPTAFTFSITTFNATHDLGGYVKEW